MVVTSPLMGVDITQVVAGTGSSSDEGNDFALGTCVGATDGQEYMYVHASAAIAQYDFVGIDENFEAAPLTAAMAGDGWHIGVAQVAIADNEFAWVATKGSNISGNVLESAAADTVLRTSATAGSLDDNTTGTQIDGVVAVTTRSTNNGEVEIIATHLRSETF